MAINPYEPELAKRQKAFEIAYSQLIQYMDGLRYRGSEFRQHMESVDEAVKDYKDTGYALAEWVEQEPES